MRYHRQTILPQIGQEGQARLAAGRVLVVGCGALGTVIAEYLVRAGVGFIRIVDRDVVEQTNLQRQTLFSEADAQQGLPKAVAAAQRLRDINTQVTLDPIVADVHPGNIGEFAGATGPGPRMDVIVDGTDNAQTRYLINDVSVKHHIPWVYGGSVGVEGRLAAFAPPATACLRCIFPTPPAGGELATCDTAGVLGPAAGAIASLQAAAVLRLLVGQGSNQQLISTDAWTGRVHALSLVDARSDTCPTCAHRNFEFLDSTTIPAATLCGRSAVQVQPAGAQVNLDIIAQKLQRIGSIEQTPYLVRFEATQPEPVNMTIFADGRTVVYGTNDLNRARALAARYVGA